MYEKVRIVYGIAENMFGQDEISIYGAFTDFKLADKIIDDLELKILKDWDADEEIEAVDFPLNKMTDDYYRTMELEDPNKS